MLVACFAPCRGFCDRWAAAGPIGPGWNTNCHTKLFYRLRLVAAGPPEPPLLDESE